jgi:hypothetical protein
MRAMKKKSLFILNTIKDIFFGYIKSFSALFRFILVCMLLGGISLGVVFPLWFFSTNFKVVFTLASIIILALAGFTFLVYKIVKLVRQQGMIMFFLKTAKLFLFLLCMAALGIIIILFTEYFSLSGTRGNLPIQESLFISVLFISIIFIYAVSKLRIYNFFSQGIYRIFMTLAVICLIYFVSILAVQARFVHFACALVIYITCFGYLLYGHKNVRKKQKQSVQS